MSYCTAGEWINMEVDHHLREYQKFQKASQEYANKRFFWRLKAGPAYSRGPKHNGCSWIHVDGELGVEFITDKLRDQLKTLFMETYEDNREYAMTRPIRSIVFPEINVEIEMKDMPEGSI